MRTKILLKFQIIPKLPALRHCACLSELPGTEFEGSEFVISINVAAWSIMCETRWRIVILIVISPILVESSYHGIVGRPFAVYLCRTFYNNKKIFGHTYVFRGGWVGWTENVILMFFCDKLGIDVAPNKGGILSTHENYHQTILWSKKTGNLLF